MLFSKWEENSGRSYAIPRPDPGLDEALTADLSQSLERLRGFCGGTADLQINRITASEVPMAFVMFEGLVNYQTLLLGAAGPLESAVAAAVGCSREKLPAVIERDTQSLRQFLSDLPAAAPELSSDRNDLMS